MIKYGPEVIPNKVVIIGCGGTGGRLVPHITQLLSTQEWMPTKKVTLIDPDAVEYKNLKRQNFIEPDVGRNKAEVLAERYGTAYDMETAFFPEFARKSGTAAMKLAIQEASVIIMCVDTVKARHEILGLIGEMSSPAAVIIDTGNEDVFGQVAVFNNTRTWNRPSEVPSYAFDARREIEERNAFDVPLKSLPAPLGYYNTLVDGEAVGSCADLDQTLAINNLVAAVAIGIFQNLVFSIPMNFYRIRVSLMGGYSTDTISNQLLKDLLSAESEEFCVPGLLKGDMTVGSSSKATRLRNDGTAALIETAGLICATQREEQAAAA